MSDTPRTDAAQTHAIEHDGSISRIGRVPVDFARQLEAELATAKAVNDLNVQSIEKGRAENKQLKAELADATALLEVRDTSIKSLMSELTEAREELAFAKSMWKAFQERADNAAPDQIAEREASRAANRPLRELLEKFDRARPLWEPPRGSFLYTAECAGEGPQLHALADELKAALEKGT